jgi:triacylglycerol esterase/lipase EstA (alpha/beta hydrolase family)
VTSKITAILRARSSQLAVLLTLVFFVTGCSTPIGVVRGTTQDVYYALTANVLSAGEPSSLSKQVLQRTNLVELFDADATAALAELHKSLAALVGNELATQYRLFALSELSFYHAEQSGKSEDYLASAIYAYAFLFPEEGAPQLDPLDPRVRLAADLYNLGLVRGLAAPAGEEVVLREGKLSLPFGELDLSVDQNSFLWSGFRFNRFIPVGDFLVRGFSNRYRQAGIGAPLAAELEPIGSGPAAEEARKRIPPRLKVPVTAIVQIHEPRRTVVSGKLKGKLEVYAADRTSTVKIDGREVPLELEPTAALAYTLEGSPVWDFEFAGFRFADKQQILGDGLIMMQPYRPGRIPVVLVHGTASSPARWADMINELTHDPVIEGRYQFWLFQYNTGQPILYSAMLFRRALNNIVKELDPQGKDPALQQMVIAGHSQGGLLTKLMTIKSGNRFWKNVSDVPFDQVEMPSETRQLLREAMFFDPVPTVTEVIFIATPHRGSYQASGWVVNLVSRLINLPGNLFSQLGDLLAQPAFAQLQSTRLPTSIDNMSPGHPFLRALNDLPIDPSISAHSIIAVLGERPITGKTDGVVAYESAHIDGVASEKVVRSGHSTQSHPETIMEMRRILREHIGVR